MIIQISDFVNGSGRKLNNPVVYNENEVQGLSWDKETNISKIIALCQRIPDDIITINLELDELNITSAETKTTYAGIQDYIMKTSGLKVSTLYIAQVERKCGLEVGKSYNLICRSRSMLGCRNVRWRRKC